jgi:hypothetical protein
VKASQASLLLKWPKNLMSTQTLHDTTSTNCLQADTWKLPLTAMNAEAQAGHQSCTAQLPTPLFRFLFVAMT